jgi:hypothetical protein
MRRNWINSWSIKAMVLLATGTQIVHAEDLDVLIAAESAGQAKSNGGVALMAAEEAAPLPSDNVGRNEAGSPLRGDLS